MWGWFAYKAGLRVMGVRDIFHREWNDVIGALKQAELWWVVILTTLAYHLPYGPWDGSSWYQRMVESAADLVAHTPA
eukprot:4953431-Lingulodinium_polyedra.AAC.1